MTQRLQPAQESAFFEQPRTKDGDAMDESKRRKIIRWIKKTMGITETEEHPRRSYGRRDHSSRRDGKSRSCSEQMLSRESLHGPNGTGGGVLLHGGVKSPRRRHRCATVSTTSTVSGCSSTDESPSIYEYHHRMPTYRVPRADPYGRNHRPHVVIIGGGIGGLCLAQGLRKNGIPFTIFERDPAPNFRTQGYRLRINSSGYQALKANLTRENFEVFLRSTGHFLPDVMYMDAETGGAAPEGVQFAHHSSVTQHVFSTDRAMLRSLLLTDLVEGSEIQFGMTFKRYQILSNGRIEVQFENGKCVEGSVLVGADGTTSRVRRQYVPRHITLLDTDCGAIHGKTPITPELEEAFPAGCTTMVTSHDSKMAVVIEPPCATRATLQEYISATGGLANAANEELPELPNYLCWVLFARVNEFHVRNSMTVHDLYNMSPHDVAGVSNELTAKWCPRVRRLFETQDPEWASFLRISTMSPDIKTWRPSCVTLLGDAVHTMVPAGIGCNTAMFDAKVLVKLFTEYGVNVDAIAQYERAMREHGREGIAISMDAGKRMYGLPDYKQMRRVVY